MARYQEEQFGNCPVCGKTDGYVNISCNHWFVCHEHKTKWFVGSGLFPSWENEREIDWLGNAVLLGRYEDVEPVDSKKPTPVSPAQKEEVSYRDLNKQLDRRRILVIDDEPTVRQSCERIFAERDYDVETAASAKEGLERAMRGYFDCALIDLKLPDMDGMEIVRDTRKKRSSMPVLIETPGRIGLYQQTLHTGRPGPGGGKSYSRRGQKGFSNVGGDKSRASSAKEKEKEKVKQKK